MVATAFADTSYFLAASNSADQWHAMAQSIGRTFTGRVVTTEFVLVELGALMSFGRARRIYAGLVAEIRHSKDISVTPASTELFEAGYRLFCSRPDKAWSMVDCLSFEVMDREGIRDALTTDHHFEQAGFNRLLT